MHVCECVWVCVSGPPGSLHQPPLTTSCLPSFIYSLLPLMKLATSFLRWGNTQTHAHRHIRQKCVCTACVCMHKMFWVSCVSEDWLGRSSRRHKKMQSPVEKTEKRKKKVLLNFLISLQCIYKLPMSQWKWEPMSKLLDVLVNTQIIKLLLILVLKNRGAHSACTQNMD